MVKMMVKKKGAVAPGRRQHPKTHTTMSNTYFSQLGSVSQGSEKSQRRSEISHTGVKIMPSKGKKLLLSYKCKVRVKPSPMTYQTKGGDGMTRVTLEIL